MMMVGVWSFLMMTCHSHAEDLHVTTSEYLPFTSEYAEHYGFCSHIVSTVIQQMGMDPVYTFYPWKRGQNQVKAGEMWATFPYVKTPEREQTYWFSAQPLFIANVKFFYSKDYLSDAIQWETLEDLQSYTIGGVRGYWYETDFANAGLTVEYTNNPEQSIKKLQAGRITLFPLTDVVGWYLIEQLFPDQKDRFGTLDKPYDITPTYLMVSKSYPNSEHLLKQFDEMFQQMKDDGTYQHILNEYGIGE